MIDALECYNACMRSRTQELLSEALALPTEERADIIAELLSSLEEPTAADETAVQAAWAREIERRARRVIAGESAGEPWEEVRQRIAGDLAKR